MIERKYLRYVTVFVSLFTFAMAPMMLGSGRFNFLVCIGLAISALYMNFKSY